MEYVNNANIKFSLKISL